MSNTQQAFDFSCQVTRGYQYLCYLPSDYDTSKSWPLVLFLHGAGQRGQDLEQIKKHGLTRVINEGQNFPFIAVSPQCQRWWEPDVLIQLIDQIMLEYPVDPDRVYVTGLSMGGYGTWDLAVHYPDRFAAIAPICGGGDPKQAYKLKDIPTWVFHGAKDDIVKLKESEEMVKAIEASGGDKVQFTIYPEAKHDSWTETYANPELYRWLLAQRRQPTIE